MVPGRVHKNYCKNPPVCNTAEAEPESAASLGVPLWRELWARAPVSSQIPLPPPDTHTPRHTDTRIRTTVSGAPAEATGI